MRKLSVFAHVSLDGVIQHSDDGDGFPHADWSAPYRSPEGRDVLLGLLGEQYDLLLGRRTYDIWSGHFPQAPAGPMVDRINAATKHVLTHRPDSLAWQPALPVTGDIAAAVRQLKAQAGPNLVLWGSTSLLPALFSESLVDELVLISYPLIVGTGKRLFPAAPLPRMFELQSSQSFASGIVLSVYRMPVRH